MQSISKETIEIIHTFFNNLNEEQIKENLEILIAKQPNLYESVIDFFEDETNESKLGYINFMFCFSIRCYEYFYGELKVIDDEIITNTVMKWNDFFKYSRKKLTPSHVINEFNRAIRQPEMYEYLNETILQSNEVQNIYDQEEIILFLTQYMIIFDIFND